MKHTLVFLAIGTTLAVSTLSTEAHAQATSSCTPEHAAMGHCTLPAEATQRSTASSGCTPEHAAMGHCTLPPAPKQATSAHAHHGGGNACTPEHAAMGHCSLPETAEASASHAGHAQPQADACTSEHATMGHCTPASTGLSEPRTPFPALTREDFAAAFPELHHHAMEHASPVSSMVLFERLEAWDTDHGTGQAWEAGAWIGTDLNRVWLNSEGERTGGRTESLDVELLYGRSVTPWWDLVVGVRQDTRPDSRTWAAFGVQGLAPHLFEVSATGYVGSGGQVQVKVEAEYELRFTNRLILQPLVEVSAALKDEPDEGIGSGLGKLEAGLRLRYEICRRFAPYVGVVHERAFGNTADYAGHARDSRFVAGVRLWF